MEECHFLACNFTKSNTPPWVFFAFLKLYKWYQIAQIITYMIYFVQKDIWEKQKWDFWIIQKFAVLLRGGVTLQPP